MGCGHYGVSALSLFRFSSPIISHLYFESFPHAEVDRLLDPKLVDWEVTMQAWMVTDQGLPLITVKVVALRVLVLVLVLVVTCL